MLRQIKWWVQNWPITKNRVLTVTTFFLWRFYINLRTSYKEFNRCTNDPNVHIRAFCKPWSFILWCFFTVSIHNLLWRAPTFGHEKTKFSQPWLTYRHFQDKNVTKCHCYLCVCTCVLFFLFVFISLISTFRRKGPYRTTSVRRSINTFSQKWFIGFF